MSYGAVGKLAELLIILFLVSLLIFSRRLSFSFVFRELFVKRIASFYDFDFVRLFEIEFPDGKIGAIFTPGIRAGINLSLQTAALLRDSSNLTKKIQFQAVDFQGNGNPAVRHSAFKVDTFNFQ